MIRRLYNLTIAMLLTLAPVALADTDSPFVEVNVSPESVMVGESLRLEVIVFVPTWFSGTPVFPSFELTNSVTRLPPDSSYPTSRRINGDTWSGIVRHYQVSPLIAANFEMNNQVIKVSWANPGNPELTAEVTVPAIRYRGTVPAGAESLSPFVAGSAFAIERNLSDYQKLVPGDAIVLETIAHLDGLPGFFIPELSIDLPEGVRAYPSEPVVAATSRTEKVTLVLDTPGQITIPGKTISWWHTEKRQIETARVDPITLTVTGATERRKSTETSLSWLIILAVLFISPVLFLAGHAVLSTLEPDAETLAFQAATKALQSKNAHEAYVKMTIWSQRASGLDISKTFPASRMQSLEALSKHVYRDRAIPVDFNTLKSGLGEARQATRRQKSETEFGLPPLNP